VLSDESSTEPTIEGKKIRITTNKNSDSNDCVYVDESTDWNEIKIELIKRFHLDSVWIGMLSKIGTDI
jgi:hypothetical protein